MHKFLGRKLGVAAIPADKIRTERFKIPETVDIKCHRIGNECFGWATWPATNAEKGPQESESTKNYAYQPGAHSERKLHTESLILPSVSEFIAASTTAVNGIERRSQKPSTTIV